MVSFMAEGKCMVNALVKYRLTEELAPLYSSLKELFIKERRMLADEQSFCFTKSDDEVELEEITGRLSRKEDSFSSKYAIREKDKNVFKRI